MGYGPRLAPACSVATLVLLANLVAAWGTPDGLSYDSDPDGDRLTNLQEFKLGTNPLNPDTDMGGCWDGWEVFWGLDPTNRWDDGRDLDYDGWSCAREYVEGTDPRNPNTDGDIYPYDSLDPYPLVPEYPSRGTLRATPGGISGTHPAQDEGQGNGQGQGQGAGLGGGQGQGQGQGNGEEPPGPGTGLDHDFDGLVEFIGSLPG
jgi:hypothetical protein